MVGLRKEDQRLSARLYQWWFESLKQFRIWYAGWQSMTSCKSVRVQIKLLPRPDWSPLVRTQEARVALCCALSNSYASLRVPQTSCMRHNSMMHSKARIRCQLVTKGSLYKTCMSSKIKRYRFI